MKKGAGTGLVFVSPLRVRMRYMVHLHFPSSNNVAEYEALVNGLRIAIELGVRRLDVWGDSQLVVDQVMKESSYHDAKMAAYYQEIQWMEDKFDGLKLNDIPRCLNEAANTLAKQHPAESRCQRASSPATNTNPRCATEGQKGPTMVRLIQP